nr:centromere protein I [Oryctolagus cuniculus]XP_008271351.2 centromere protein I [Oryctolagus cuniculus]XP_008271353.2 centromere protein I [Oryctolagus cuniculus]XP_017205491.2 centromere protein I [Oryctolagus cuniculus]XP_051683424.1 centromere protein I [Oryctolagus cuniculus]XP_051683425.1 centromere protein I [Oryctolagus cuniculus]
MHAVMMPQKTGKNQAQNRPSQGSSSYQTNLSACEVKQKPSDSKENNPMQDDEHADDQDGDVLQIAMEYFEKDPIRSLRSKDKILEKHLITMENVAWKNGLAPETIDILLNVALSGRFGNAVNTRILKCLIPATLISEDSVVKAVSWLCVGKCSGSTKVLFYRWLIAMFDFIDHKEQINLLYGFFFASLQDDVLCPYVCHLLYLLTKKENVKPFRVRKLLDLQAKMGMQPHLQALLSVYKFFVPTLISVSLPVRKKIYFKNSENLWKTALLAVRQRNQGLCPEPRKLMLGPANIRPLKRKWNSHSIIPVLNSSSHTTECGKKEMNLSEYLSSSGSLPLEQLQRFPQLLENIHCLELPSQMGSVLNNSLLLHYINCIRDESVLLRLYHWLSQTLQEECVWYKVNNYENGKEFASFLDTIIRAESFLHEGFYSCEAFLYKSLPLWDGFCCRSQVLQLVSWIPFNNFSEMKPLLFDHLAHLFFTSTIYFKCSIIESLKELLQNWLLWLSKDIHVKPVTDSPLDTSLCESMNSVFKLVHYVGWLSTIGMRLERNSTFLMHFILDFFETACDIYLIYNLPLVVLFPRAIFYSALFTLDASILNQLCYIMHRYHKNLTAAKKNELIQKAKSKLSFSSKTYKEFNCCLTTMVGCLWTSKPFKKGIRFSPETLEKLGVEEHKRSLNLVYHSSLLGYAVSFLLQETPEEKTINLSSIQGKKWNLYLDYLFSEELQGLKLFIESCIRRSSVS